jgi:hypothetical protein
MLATNSNFSIRRPNLEKLGGELISLFTFLTGRICSLLGLQESLIGGQFGHVVLPSLWKEQANSNQGSFIYHNSNTSLLL